MNPTEHSWQQELAAIEAEIDSLKQRREVQQAELRRLQESDATVLDESERTQPWRNRASAVWRVWRSNGCGRGGGDRCEFRGFAAFLL